MTPPQCTDVDFRVERLEPLDPWQQTLEFTEEPSVKMSAWSTSVHDIVMQVAQASVGTARYRITPMSPAWLLTGTPLELDIQVEPVNVAPSFEAFDIVVPQTVLPLLPVITTSPTASPRDSGPALARTTMYVLLFAP